MDFAQRHNIPRNITRDATSFVASITCRGPVTVLSTTGRYHSALSMEVLSSHVGDVVLGGDWFEATGAVIADGLLLDPAPESTHPPNHSWTPGLHSAF